MQLAAIGAIDIGEDGDRVFRIPRAEYHHVRFGHARKEFAANVPAAHLGQIVIFGKVIKVTRDRILTVGGDVGDVGAVDELPDTRNGRGAQLIRRRSRNFLGQLDARIGRRRGRFGRECPDGTAAQNAQQ